MYDWRIVMWAVFAFIIATLILLVRKHIQDARAEVLATNGTRELPEIWDFEASEKPEGGEAAMIDAFVGTLEQATDWIENAGCAGRKTYFRVAKVDYENHRIVYDVDWLNYRESFPSKWCAMKQLTGDGIKGGVFYTSLMKRSDAIKFVAAAGPHTIREVWDKDRIVFYAIKS